MWYDHFTTCMLSVLLYRLSQSRSAPSLFKLLLQYNTTAVQTVSYPVEMVAFFLKSSALRLPILPSFLLPPPSVPTVCNFHRLAVFWCCACRSAGRSWCQGESKASVKDAQAAVLALAKKRGGGKPSVATNPEVRWLGAYCSTRLPVSRPSFFVLVVDLGRYDGAFLIFVVTPFLSQCCLRVRSQPCRTRPVPFARPRRSAESCGDSVRRRCGPSWGSTQSSSA